MYRSQSEGLRWLHPLLLTALLCFSGAPYARTQEASAQARSLLAAAKTHVAQGDLQGAERNLWSVLSAEPENQEALTLLGIIRGRQQRYLESEVLFQRLLRLNPKSVVAYTNLADALAAQGKLDQAIEQCKQAQILAPQDSDLKLRMARLYVKQGLFTEALSTLDLIPLQRLPAAAIPIKAASLVALGRKSEAVALIPQAKDSPGIAMDLAEVFLEGKLPYEAIRALALASPALQGTHSRFYYLEGRAQRATGQATAALKNFRKALTLDPKSIDILLAIADIYAAQNKHADAIAILGRARTLAPDAAPVLRRVVIEAMNAGENRTALEAALELEHKSSENLDDKYLIAAVLLQEQEYAEASQIFEMYLAQRPQDSGAWLGLGLARLNQQRYSDARNALERSLQLDPDLTEAQYELGVVASKEGNIQEAIQRFEHVLQEHPNHAKALLNVGTLYLQAGELEKAESALQRSEAADRTDPDTQYQMSLLSNRIGEAEEARQHMERFRQLKQERERAGQKARREQPNTR
jgi:tetratricopeptide (TPR) repeat protein